MFSGLDVVDARHGRRWTALTSFILQGILVSAALILPLLNSASLPDLKHRIFTPITLGDPHVRPSPDTVQHGGGQVVPIVVQHPFTFPSGPIHDVSDSSAGVRDPQIGIVQPGAGTGINSILTGEYVQPVLRPDTTKPRPVSVVMESNLIHRVQPQYPAIARQIRLQGDVIIRAVISRAGAIEQATVLSGSPLLASAALDAVKQWRYRPYSLNGESVEVETQITVKFILN